VIQDSESRETKYLDGIWNFRISSVHDPDEGFRETWYKRSLLHTRNASKDVIAMPVPSSYNDITQSQSIRDYVGWVWYDRSFFVPQHWSSEDKTEVFLRFGSAHYIARVWINGVMVTEHVGGHLPFEAKITEFLK
jgi:beta-glucuronidase